MTCFHTKYSPIFVTKTVKNYEELEILLCSQMNKLTCHSFMLFENTRLLDQRQGHCITHSKSSSYNISIFLLVP